MAGGYSHPVGRARAFAGRLVWPAALTVFILLWQFGQDLAPWAFKYPAELIIPVADWITRFTKWLLNDASFGVFTFRELTRFISAVIDAPYRLVMGLLSTGLMSGGGSWSWIFTLNLMATAWVPVLMMGLLPTSVTRPSNVRLG